MNKEIPKDKKTAVDLWNDFGNTPIDDNDLIETQFLHFEPGTNRFDIWHWFEEYFELSIATELQFKPTGVLL